MVNRLSSLSSSQIFTSSITLGELIYGAYRVRAARPNLLAQIEQLLVPLDNVLPFDSQAARVYGEVRAELENRGEFIGDADVRIASIALAHDLTVVTGNVRHFSRVAGLRLENWL